MSYPPQLPRAWACLLLIALVALAPAPSRAEATAAEKAAAEALFDHGLTLLRSGRVEEACQRLEQSQAIERAIGTLLYLAECYEHLGRTASAWALFREAGSAARTARQEERTQIADERARRLEASLAKLTLEPEPGAPEAELEVRVDELRQPAGLWGVPVPMDPGEHRLSVQAPGMQPWSVALTLAPGEQRTVRIPALTPEVPAARPVALAPSPEPAEPAAQQPATAPQRGGSVPPPRSLAQQPERPRKRSAGARALAIAVGSAGLAAAGVGTYFGVRAIQKNRDAEAYCPGGGSACTDARGLDLTDDAQRSARLANGLVFGGAGVAAVGLLIYLLRPGERAPRVALSPAAGGASVSLRGAF